MATKSKVSSKFVERLTASNESIKDNRARIIASSASTAQQAIIQKLIERKNKLELELENLYDLSPGTTVSLKFAENFDATKWAEAIQNAKIQLANLSIELKIANDTNEEWFGKAGD